MTSILFFYYKGATMHSVDSEYLSIRVENDRLKRIYKDKLEDWRKVALQAKKVSIDEYDKTRPLFDEAMKAYHDWKEHFFRNGNKLLMEKIE